MARKVFFSFHYDDVVSFRANVVRNHGFFAGNQKAGFWDNSIWENAKKSGDIALKRMINEELEGTSVTCVLIGSETYARPWVRYEILKSIERGNGLFGVYINGIKDKNQRIGVRGGNPFEFLYLRRRYPQALQIGNQLDALEWNGKEWIASDKLPIVNYSGYRNLSGQLNSYFDTYDWNCDYGYDNFGTWVEKAAREAGR